MSFWNILYYGQIGLGILLGIFQGHHMLTESVQGLSISMFLCTGIFLIINLWLACASYTAKRNNEGLRIIVIYVVGVLVYIPLLGILLSKGGWDDKDTYTVIAVGVIISTVTLFAVLKGIRILDPIMKGIYSLGFKATPQLIMAWKILMIGGPGLSLGMVVIFHVLTLSRILQIGREFWKTKAWNKHLTGLAISEIGNEGSWILVTVAWLAWLLR